MVRKGPHLSLALPDPSDEGATPPPPVVEPEPTDASPYEVRASARPRRGPRRPACPLRDEEG